MNRSYSKIRHIREANSLLESRTILSEQDDKPTMNPNSTYIGNALINKVATEGIKYVTPQMISSPQSLKVTDLSEMTSSRSLKVTDLSSPTTASRMIS